MPFPDDFGMHVNVGGVWKRIDHVYVNVAGTWKEVLVVKENAGGIWKYTHLPVYRLTISANQANYNIFSAIGSPAFACFVYLTINSGVQISSSLSTAAALQTGAFAPDSGIKIINNGVIFGKGGAGGAGGNSNSGAPGNGNNGLAGGNAFDVQADIVIDNTSGYIYGGGGGGGGSAGAYGSTTTSSDSCWGGNGGGGGQGNGNGGSTPTPTGCSANYAGIAGGAGTYSAAGTGGSYPAGYPDYVNTGPGGNGGGWGVAGTAATAGSGYVSAGSPGSGGAAGKAINLNGHAITWLGGNNSTQIKGLVS